MINATTQNVLNRLLNELVSDNPSSWGGWQGGFPGGNGSPLKGMRNSNGKDHTRRIPAKKKAPGGTIKIGRDGQFKLDGTVSKVIVNPTMRQSENDIDVRDDQLTRPDNPRSQGKGRTVRQVKEDRANSVIKRFREGSRTPDDEKAIYERDILAGLVARGVSHLIKRAFSKSKPSKAAPKPKIGAQEKPQKPPTAAQLKQADFDASQAHFDAWKQKKLDMDRVFKAAHAAGIGNDINPLRVRLDKQARAANPLKQPNETPAAPTTKPRNRVQAGSRIKENEAAPTGLGFFSPLLGTTTKKRRKKRK
jgi:hypothetical protein